MRTNNILNAISTIPQWLILILLALTAVTLIMILFRLIYVVMFQPELREELREVVELYNQQKARILAEQREIDNQIQSNKNTVDKIQKPLTDTDKIRLELISQGLKEEDARVISNMSLDQLILLKGKESFDIPDNYIINAITRRVLIDTHFEQRLDVDDFKVPVNKTADFTPEMVNDFIKLLFGVSHQHKDGSSIDTYSIRKKSFAMLTIRQDEFLLKVKCGTFYAQRLTQLYPEFFLKAKFPSGMLWVDIYNRKGCSFELIKLMLIISYNIAKAGY